MKKICIVTGTRAEYGLLKNLMFNLNKEKKIKLYILVTGSHLSKKFGNTYKEILKDGFKISKQIKIKPNLDTPKGILKSISIGMKGFLKAYKQLRPDLIIILGDRYETFSAAIAAHYSRIPIAHLHGGEVTKGSTDDAIRHSITKMSHIHFVAAEKYKKRVIQLGENPKKVFNVGGLGVDNIKQTNFLSKHQLEKKLGINFKKKNLIINFHPETLNKYATKKIFNELLSALRKKANQMCLIFTMPNSDLESEIVFKMTKKFVKKNSNFYSFKSLGSTKFLSCLKIVDGMIGNSSSGLLEMPTFKKGTINIGDRQKGRLMAKSIINVRANKNQIIRAIEILFSKKFQTKIKKSKNPYGNGGASKKILKIIKTISLKNILKKEFNSNLKSLK